MNRLAISVEYDGTAYCGWQIQPHAPSVQQSLNDALSMVADEPVHCVGAGRTDTGVHASGQVAHFDTLAERSPRSWLLGVNSNLPADINLRNVWLVDEHFHARFSAIRRAYRYIILNRPVRSALARDRAWWVHRPLAVETMAAAAGCLVGEHDFSSFRAAECQARSAIRNLLVLSVAQSGDRIVIDCEANAFLHHMVRNIVGSLVRVGRGEADIDWLAGLLESRDRRLAGVTAPACGLTLTRIDYPEPFHFIGPDPMQMIGD